MYTVHTQYQEDPEKCTYQAGDQLYMAFLAPYMIYGASKNTLRARCPMEDMHLWPLGDVNKDILP